MEEKKTRIVKCKDWHELCDACYKHNEEHHVTQQYGDKHPLKCFVRIKQMPFFTKKYTKEELTYTFSSAEKRFVAGLCGNSIFADCVGDQNDMGIRLDYYLFEGGWEIEECWYEEEVE